MRKIDADEFLRLKEATMQTAEGQPVRLPHRRRIHPHTGRILTDAYERKYQIQKDGSFIRLDKPLSKKERNRLKRAARQNRAVGDSNGLPEPGVEQVDHSENGVGVFAV
jgi:hypothetical protein